MFAEPAPERIRLWVSAVPRAVFDGSKLLKDIRRIVREELRAHQDRKSFAAASDVMTQDETMAYLRASRATITRWRNARKQAKTPEQKDRAFAPDHGEGRNLRFRRSEIDAWLDRRKR